MNGKGSIRRLGLEQLETRATPAVASIALNAGVLEIRTDDLDTDVSLIGIVSKVGERRVLVSEGSNSLGGYLNVTRVEFHGGLGRDKISMGALSVPLYAWGKKGNDTLKGGSGADQLKGGDGKDTLEGSGGNDLLVGKKGRYTIEGGNGKDFILGGDASDTLKGEDHADTLFGGIGKDYLYGGDGDDKLDGESGDDYLSGDDGRDTLDGGTGNDKLYGGNGCRPWCRGGVTLRGESIVAADACTTVIG
jgi:Ca2+-binding RTX toxin-like protein